MKELENLIMKPMKRFNYYDNALDDAQWHANIYHLVRETGKDIMHLAVKGQKDCILADTKFIETLVNSIWFHNEVVKNLTEKQKHNPKFAYMNLYPKFDDAKVQQMVKDFNKAGVQEFDDHVNISNNDETQEIIKKFINYID